MAAMSDSYVERLPSPPLARAVRTVWVHTTGDQPSVHRHLPTGGVEIHARLGGIPRLIGPLTAHWIEALPPRVTIVGIRFLPASPPPLPMPLDELVEQRVPLDELWGPPVVRLAGEMAATGAADRAARMLEGFLCDRFRAAEAKDRIIREAVAVLMPWQPAEVRDVAAHVALSPSQLRRRALHAVGLTPKTLQRTLRFQGFLALAQAGAVPSGRRDADGISGLAADAGYTDQAHLNRECLRLSGLTPRQLLHGDIDRCACGHDHSASYRPFLAGRAAGPSQRSAHSPEIRSDTGEAHA